MSKQKQRYLASENEPIETPKTNSDSENQLKIVCKCIIFIAVMFFIYKLVEPILSKIVSDSKVNDLINLVKEASAYLGAFCTGMISIKFLDSFLGWVKDK